MKKIFLALLFLFPLSVRAETFSVVPITTNVNVNQLFQVDLVLDAHGDDVNAVEGILQYPHDLLQLKEIHDERSPITLWIKHPTASINSDSEFSGMIPGGTEDAHAIIFSAIFLPIKNGTAQINIANARALRNDGNGTLIPSTFKATTIEINSSTGTQPSLITKTTDSEPPEPFKPITAQDPQLFDGKWFVAFTTQDKDSGIKEYAVYESPKKLREPERELSNVSWNIGESPYQLQDQTRKSTVYVKAIDITGNERIEIVASPISSLPFYQLPEFFGILGALLLFAIARFVFQVMRSRRRS